MAELMECEIIHIRRRSEKLSSRGFAGVAGYASDAGLEPVFTGGKPCKTEKKLNPGTDLRPAIGKLIHSIQAVTLAGRNIHIESYFNSSHNRLFMLNIKTRIEYIEDLLKKDTTQSITYAALECRLTIEMICYERLIISYDYLSYDDLKKWQPKDVVKQVIEDVSALADKELTLSVAKIPPGQKLPETIEEHEGLEYHKIGTQATLDIRSLGKLWNALSNAALHVSLPKSKNEELQLYGQPDSIRKHVEKTLLELEKIKDDNLLMGGSIEPSYGFNCLKCGALIKRNSKLLKSINIVNCILPSCNESYILEKDGADFSYSRRKFDLPCEKCGEITEIPYNYLKNLRLNQTLYITCGKCETKMEIVLHPSLVKRKIHEGDI